jgi:hypothetical protein
MPLCPLFWDFKRIKSIDPKNLNVYGSTGGRLGVDIVKCNKFGAILFIFSARKHINFWITKVEIPFLIEVGAAAADLENRQFYHFFNILWQKKNCKTEPKAMLRSLVFFIALSISKFREAFLKKFCDLIRLKPYLRYEADNFYYKK